MSTLRTGILALVATVVAISTAASAQLDAGTADLATPRAEDAGVYAVAELDVEGTSTEPVDPVTFHVGEPRTLEDAYGQQRDAWPITLDLPQGPHRGDNVDDKPRISWVPGLGLAPLARTEAHERVRDKTSQGPLGDTEYRQWAAFEQTDHAHAGDQLHGPACLLTPPWEGTRLTEGRNLPLDRFCGQALADDGEAIDDNASVNVAEVVDRADEPTAVRLNVEVGANATRVDLDLWYTTDVPYPRHADVHVGFRQDAWPRSSQTSKAPDAIVNDVLAFPLSTMLGHPGIPDGPRDRDGDGWARWSAELELTRFDRGEGAPLAHADRPAWPAQHEDARREPVERWGPAVGAIDLAFPREQAVDAIETDPQMHELHDWQERHPDHRAVAASYQVDEASDPPTAKWHFVLAAPDGTGYQVTSVKRLLDTQDAPAQGPTGTPAIENHAGRDDGDRWVTPHEQAVTWASAVDAWRSHWHDELPGEDANRMRWQSGPIEHRFAVDHVDEERQQAHEPGGDEREKSFYTLTLDADDGAKQAHARSLFRTTEERLTAEPPQPTPAPWEPPEPATAADPDPVPTFPGDLGLGVGALLLALLARFGLVPLYNGLTRDELLDNETRRRIHEILQDDAGTSASEIATRTEVSRSTVRHHLRKLAEGGLVEQRQAGGKVLWFPRGDQPPDELDREAALSTGRSREVYRAIQAQPGTSLQDVAERTDLSLPSVQRVVDRLVDEGLVDKHREGRQVSLHPD